MVFASMLILLLIGAFCLFGAVLCNKRPTGYERKSYDADALVIKKETMRYRPAYRGGKVTKYLLYVRYTNNNGKSSEGRITTGNRCAGKIKELDNIDIVVTDREIRLKKDTPVNTVALFLLLSAGISFGLSVLLIICEMV